MLRAELKKTWSRPFILVAFVIVCLAQIIYVFSNYNEETKVLSDAYNAVGGQMDDKWRNNIIMQYGQLWEKSPESAEDVWMATAEQKAVLTAYDYVHFTEVLDDYVESIGNIYGEAAETAYSGLRTASENGELIFGASLAGEAMANQYMITWGFLIFMILLCIDQFSGEKETGMTTIQSVSKHGRRKLFQTKLMVCQLSAFFAWTVNNLVYAMTLTICYGWGNLQSVIQDFSLNACPYNWDVGEYTAVVLIVGFITSQVTAFVIFLLAKAGRTTQHSFALMGGILILPYLFAFFMDNIWLALWLPCLMNNQWLWNGLKLIELGSRYLPLWCIAGAEVIIIMAVAVFLLRRSINVMETEIEI